MKARIIFLYGPPASGKLTVARTLSELAKVRLFHNHLTVDLLLAVFPFGSSEFVRLREQIWMEVMADAMRAGTDVIFTFAPERTVNADFIANLQRKITEAGGAITFVELKCSEEVIENRLGDSSRSGFKKLTTLEEYRALKKSGAFEFGPIPSDYTIDTGKVSAKDAAELLAAELQLKRAECPQPDA